MWHIDHALLYFIFCAFWIPWTIAVQLDIGNPGMFWSMDYPVFMQEHHFSIAINASRSLFSDSLNGI
jgi:hypothetical protein